MKELTIFSIPKGFSDPHIAHIQSNAIASWCAVRGADVLIMGNDPGVKEAADRFGATHVPDIATNEYGTPMLDSAFSVAHERATTPYVMYINGDIVLPPTFADALPSLPSGAFLGVGQRTDLDIEPSERLTDAASVEALIERARRDGTPHSVQGIDYFLFRRGRCPQLPPFAVGRMAFDNWILWRSRQLCMPIVDMTEEVTVVHQNHPPVRASEGAGRKTNPEAIRNLGFMRKMRFYTIADADWHLSRKGLRPRLLYFLPQARRLGKILLRR